MSSYDRGGGLSVLDDDSETSFGSRDDNGFDDGNSGSDSATKQAAAGKNRMILVVPILAIVAIAVGTAAYLCTANEETREFTLQVRINNEYDFRGKQRGNISPRYRATCTNYVSRPVQ